VRENADSVDSSEKSPGEERASERIFTKHSQVLRWFRLSSEKFL
jgi:hypothetical protein